MTQHKTAMARAIAGAAILSTAFFISGCEDNRASGSSGNTNEGSKSSNFGITGNPYFNPESVSQIVSLYFGGMEAMETNSQYVINAHASSDIYLDQVARACTTGIMRSRDDAQANQAEYEAERRAAQRAAKEEAVANHRNALISTLRTEVTLMRGTDQNSNYGQGWLQNSLIESLKAQNIPPYEKESDILAAVTVSVASAFDELVEGYADDNPAWSQDITPGELFGVDNLTHEPRCVTDEPSGELVCADLAGYRAAAIGSWTQAIMASPPKQDEIAAARSGLFSTYFQSMLLNAIGERSDVNLNARDMFLEHFSKDFSFDSTAIANLLKDVGTADYELAATQIRAEARNRFMGAIGGNSLLPAHGFASVVTPISDSEIHLQFNATINQALRNRYLGTFLIETPAISIPSEGLPVHTNLAGADPLHLLPYDRTTGSYNGLVNRARNIYSIHRGYIDGQGPGAEGPHRTSDVINLDVFIGHLRASIADYLSSEEAKFRLANPPENFGPSESDDSSGQTFNCETFANLFPSNTAGNHSELARDLQATISRDNVRRIKTLGAKVDSYDWLMPPGGSDNFGTLNSVDYTVSGDVVRFWPSSGSNSMFGQTNDVSFSKTLSESYSPFTGALEFRSMSFRRGSVFDINNAIYPSSTSQNFFLLEGTTNEVLDVMFNKEQDFCQYTSSIRFDTSMVPEFFNTVENDFNFQMNDFYNCGCSVNGDKIAPTTCQQATIERSISIDGGANIRVSGTSEELPVTMTDRGMHPAGGVQSLTFTHSRLDRPLSVEITRDAGSEVHKLTGHDGSSVTITREGSSFNVDSIFCRANGLSRTAILNGSYCQ